MLYETPSDSSILKSLAVAFGDGLAFGVGIKIAQASSAAIIGTILLEGRTPVNEFIAAIDPLVLDRQFGRPSCRSGAAG